MNIHVSNLSLNILDTDLRKLFSAYGEVSSAIIVRNQVNGRSSGTALVDMVNASQGRQAILCLNNMFMDGKFITVSELHYSIRNNQN